MFGMEPLSLVRLQCGTIPPGVWSAERGHHPGIQHSALGRLRLAGAPRGGFQPLDVPLRSEFVAVDYDQVLKRVPTIFVIAVSEPEVADRPQLFCQL